MRLWMMSKPEDEERKPKPDAMPNRRRLAWVFSKIYKPKATVTTRAIT